MHDAVHSSEDLVGEILVDIGSMEMDAGPAFGHALQRACALLVLGTPDMQLGHLPKPIKSLDKQVHPLSRDVCADVPESVAVRRQPLLGGRQIMQRKAVVQMDDLFRG
jgi:hypothetical protein